MKKLLFLLITLSALIFTSCGTDLSLTLNKDGSVNIEFNATSGSAFSKFIYTATKTNPGEQIFDLNTLKTELSKGYFTNVKASSKNGLDIYITAKDEKQKTPFFSSKIFTVKNNKLVLSVSPDKLRSFYANSDEQTVNFLDLLIAPVFNDEQMSPSEYTELIGAVYGKDVAQELKDSVLKITLINPDNTKRIINLPLTTLLTLNEVLEL